MASEATIAVQSNGSTFLLPTLAFQGLPSTLCKGCGHNSITSYLIEACKSVGVNPYKTIKLSGIGCSSKTPAYFLQYSHGFNALHGRMPSVATGAVLANHHLQAIGISGDGDTANIGLGQFKHICRRNLPLLYIVEDNGGGAMTVTSVPEADGTCSLSAERITVAPYTCASVAQQELRGTQRTQLLSNFAVHTDPKDRTSSVSLIDSPPGCLVIRRYVEFGWKEPAAGGALDAVRK